ncbi:hypothetical protein ACJIZ3_007730 [Penstemon smallii]|uniref:NLP1-9 GAF domain-containing protein n=1 Tax=Penstemon smallii TaxID=265156 RepID=A0ABD3T7T0_9LAMI
MENAEEYFADWVANDHLSATVYWKPELNLSPESSTSPVKQGAIREKIIQALGEIASRNRDACCLLQFWAHKVFDGRSYITNMDQPFAVGGERSVPSMTKFYSYLNHSLKQGYYVGGEEKEEEDNTNVGCVFRNGHPEISPHLYLYSTKEYPLRNKAALCGFKAYMSLPVFDDLDQQHCLGVLEYLTFEVGFEDYEIQVLDQGLKAAKLRSTHTSSISVPIHNNIGQEAAAQEIRKMIQGVMIVPLVVGTQVYVPCGQCPKSTSCMEMKLSYFHEPPFEFVEACKFHGVQMGKGVAGIALESQNKFITDYPLAHFAQRARLNASFAICLQSSHTGNDIYVIEFFLQYPTGSKQGYPMLLFLLKKMKINLKSFKIASDRQLGEELVVKVIDFENFNFKFGQHDNTFPLKFEITRYDHEMEHQYVRNHQVQVNSAENMAEEGQDNAAANLEKGIAAMESNREGNKMKCAIQYEVPKPHSGRNLQDVLENLRVNKSTLKCEIIDCGINNSWPSSKKIKKNPDAIFEAAANARKCAQGSSGGSRSPPPVLPL